MSSEDFALLTCAVWIVGAAWFKRVSEALEQDPGSSYRRWIAALCPDLLKGAFNHDARTEVRDVPISMLHHLQYMQ